MKNLFKNIVAVIMMVLLPAITTLAQPPAPDPFASPGGVQQINCNATPVGNGFWIMLALAVAYGVYKFYQIRRTEQVA